MSDFLDRLIKKAQGTASPVRPLLAPRFAQGPSLAGSLEDKSEWAETSDIQESSDVTGTESTSTQRVPRPKAKPTQSNDIQAGDIPPEPSITAASIPSPIPAPEPGSPPETILTGSTQAIEILLYHEPEMHKPDTSPSKPEKADETISASTTHKVVEEVEANESQNRRPGQPIRYKNEGVGESLSPSEILKLEITERSTLVIPQEDGRVSNTLRLAPDRPPAVQKSASVAGIAPLPKFSEITPELGPKPQPVVHVTIGRIEVRAVTPPTPPPHPIAARLRPALSLDDYLKQRSGGSR